MFKYEDVVLALKSLASAEDTPQTLPHCQKIEFQSRKLGFQSYHHFLHSLKQLPPDSFASLSLGLMRRICAKRLPTKEDCPYFEFVPLQKGVGYYSYWIGWDKNGDEVRVPRPLAGMSSVRGLRRAVDFPIYVVESERELLAWSQVWRSSAYLPEDLAKKHFAKSFEKRHLVVEDPPMDLVEKKAGGGRYDSNFVRDDDVDDKCGGDE